MQQVDPRARSYDATTRFLHWATAILVAEQWLGAQIIDWFSGDQRVDARSVHITLGVTLLVLLLARVAWRLTRGRRLPLADHRPALNLLAKLTHWGLYALLAAMVAVGVALTWARGDSLFNLFRIPSFAPGNRAVSHQLQDIHAILGYVILAVAGVHAVAALVHGFVWRDGVLARMWPGRPVLSDRLRTRQTL